MLAVDFVLQPAGFYCLAMSDTYGVVIVRIHDQEFHYERVGALSSPPLSLYIAQRSARRSIVLVTELIW